MADELDALLGSYKVEAADADLLDRITARAASLPRRRRPWLAQAAMMAGVALLGFWLGGGQPATAPAVTADVSATPASVEKVIFGAHTIDEVLL